MIIANSPYLKLQNIFFAREFVKWLVIILSRHQLHKITPSFSFLLPLAVVVDSDAKKMRQEIFLKKDQAKKLIHKSISRNLFGYFALIVYYQVKMHVLFFSHQTLVYILPGTL